MSENTFSKRTWCLSICLRTISVSLRALVDAIYLKTDLFQFFIQVGLAELVVKEKP